MAHHFLLVQFLVAARLCAGFDVVRVGQHGLPGLEADLSGPIDIAWTDFKVALSNGAPTSRST